MAFEKMTVVLPPIRCTDVLRNSLTKAAREDSKELSEFIRAILAAEIERRESPFRPKPVDASEFGSVKSGDEV